MPSAQSGPGFARPQPVTALPEAGLDVAIEAKPGERDNLARYLGVLEVRDLRAQLTLKRWRGAGLQIAGTIQAKLMQTCVVTLDPVETVISAEIDRKFLPPAALGADAPVHELIVDPEGEDPPEPQAAIMDLGAIVAEELALAIDPYPRSQAALDQETGQDPEPAKGTSPFEALKNLVKGPKTPS